MVYYFGFKEIAKIKKSPKAISLGTFIKGINLY
jgi:hypothetical protein